MHHSKPAKKILRLSALSLSKKQKKRRRKTRQKSLRTDPAKAVLHTIPGVTGIVVKPYPSHLWLLKESISNPLCKFQCLYSVFRTCHTPPPAILWTSSQSVGFILRFMPTYADGSSCSSMLGVTIESSQKESLNPSSSTLYKASNSFVRCLAHQHRELSSGN